MVSSNFDRRIADIITQIYEQDPHGFNAVSIGGGESKYQLHPTLEHVKGYSFSQGFLSPYFAMNDQLKNKGNAYVYLSDSIVESQQDLLPVLEFAAKVKRLVIVVAPDFKADALTGMVVNHLNGKVQICAIKLPLID